MKMAYLLYRRYAKVYFSFSGAPRRIRSRATYAHRSRGSLREPPKLTMCVSGNPYQSTVLSIHSRSPSNPALNCTKKKGKEHTRCTFPFLARRAGFEPATYRFVAGHSIHWASSALVFRTLLYYHIVLIMSSAFLLFLGKKVLFFW